MQKKKKAVAFKNNAPSINCISKINQQIIDNAEDLDVVMPLQNLLEYSKSYKKTTGSLWNYYRYQPLIIFQLILNLLNTKQVLQEVIKMLLLMMMMMMMMMMQKKLVKKKLKLLFH